MLGEKIDGLVANNLKDAKFPDGVLDSMKPALSASKNLAGWLTIPGTEMDTSNSPSSEGQGKNGLLSAVGKLIK